jgi:DNA-directed RNA polymerase subunit F
LIRERKTNNFGHAYYINIKTQALSQKDPMIDSINQNVKYIKQFASLKYEKVAEISSENLKILQFRKFESNFYLQSKIKNTRINIIQPIFEHENHD